MGSVLLLLQEKHNNRKTPDRDRNNRSNLLIFFAETHILDRNCGLYQNILGDNVPYCIRTELLGHGGGDPV